MGHGHHHHHADAGDRRMVAAIAVNGLLTVVQVVGGVLSGSLSLIADALHNFSDAASLLIAAWARRIARRPADASMTFGYARAEIVAALINLTTLAVIGLYLAFEAVMRFLDPEPITGWLVVAVATVALVVDLLTAALTWAMARDSVNIRAAFLHNLADALGSVAVIVAGLAIWAFGWLWVDPAVTLAIAGYILWMAWSEIGEVVRVLMLGAPVALDTEAVLRTVEGVEGITGAHHAHLWQMDEHACAFEAHVTVAAGAWSEACAIRDAARDALWREHGIGHVTLELECAVHADRGAHRIGH